MSVINRMLQDLDARQNGAREATHLYTKPAAGADERRFPVVALVGAAIGTAVIVLGAAFGWRYLHRSPTHAPAVSAPVKVVLAPAPPRIEPLPVAPAPAPNASAVASAAAATESAPGGGAAAATGGEAGRAAAQASAPAQDTAQAPAFVKPRSAKPARAARPAHQRKTAKSTAGDDKKHRQSTRHERQVAPKGTVQDDKAAAQGKQETQAQKAEAAYRRGLASIQDGYLSEGIASLEQALQANPHHEAARQTLVSVLIDAHRTDEAMRQLQLALTLDAKQPAMAMLLARLQIEHGGSGIDTLSRTLPYVGANGEYHAFLAGALQRQQRHREAIEQYAAALRSMPQNGVWLMGLGISLQAEKRDSEALEAFRKAKASGTLNGQLAAFVDSKIQQLSH